MKCSANIAGYFPESVTSYAEVWIEIFLLGLSQIWNIVTSYAEVWIEINPDS